MKVPEFIRPILSELMKGQSIKEISYLEILSFLINRNIVQLKGYVYAVPDNFKYQNIELVLKEKINFIVDIDTKLDDILLNHKISNK